VIAHGNPTTDGLLAALRCYTNRPAMAWSRPPVPLAGAFWAEMYDTQVIRHGDLQPFDLLVDCERWALIDWSTAVVADPHYDLAFTTLMLANPPLG
jgi:hypothetical protein